MAILELTELWVNLLPDGEAVHGWSLPNRKRDAEVDGEIQKYAGGRFRSVIEEGTALGLDFTMTQITLTEVETLESWLGRTVLVRTNTGQAVVGTFFGVASLEYKNNLFAASISLRSVTGAEIGTSGLLPVELGG